MVTKFPKCFSASTFRLVVWGLLLSFRTPQAYGAPGVPQYGNSARVACAKAGASCASLGTDTFSVAPSEDGNAGVESALWYFHGTFSVNLKLEPDSGSAVTEFALKDGAADAGDYDHQEIAMRLYLLPEQGATVLQTSAITNQKWTLAEFILPFDASKDFHKYGIQWGLQKIYFMLDGQPLHMIGHDDNLPWPAKALQPKVFSFTNKTLITNPSIQLQSPGRPLAHQRGVARVDGNSAKVPARTAGSLTKGATVATDFIFAGCQAPAGSNKDACNVDGVNAMALPWERPLTAAQFKAYNDMHYKYLSLYQPWATTEGQV